MLKDEPQLISLTIANRILARSRLCELLFDSLLQLTFRTRKGRPPRNIHTSHNNADQEQHNEKNKDLFGTWHRPLLKNLRKLIGNFQ